MKVRKRLLAGILTGVMAFAMAGCGGGNSAGGEGGELEALLKKADETMTTVTSMSALMDMEMTMNLEGEEYVTATKADMDILYNPMKMKMNMDMSINGESLQTYEMYVLEENETLTSYMNFAGAWYAEPMDMSAVSQYDAQQNMSLYLENLETFSSAGTEEINGKATTVIQGVLTGDSMKTALENSGLTNTTGSLGLTEEEYDELVSSLADMPVKLWISDDGYVMKYEVDMTEMMGKMMSTLGGEEAGMTFGTVTMSMTCDNYNAVEDFEIPAEALSANAA